MVEISMSIFQVDVMGKKGFQIFVDVGQPVDPNLIEALAREVLEEKVASMISNGLNTARDNPATSYTPHPPAQSTGQPQPSPRRPTVDYYLPNEHEQTGGSMDVPTPIPTPHESPVPTPRANTPRLTPQVSVERNEVPAPQPPAPVAPQPTQYVYLIPQTGQEDSGSLYEDITDEHNDVDLELDIDPRTINVPQTPEETPIPTPSPEVTPEASLVEPAPPQPKPLPQQRNLVTTSVQCDPEPVAPITRTRTPPPVAPVQPVQPPSPQLSTKSKLRKIKVESINIEPTETDLTASSSNSSNNDLSTTLDTSKSSDIESDSYMSEGAWLMSKSEGQIVFEERKGKQLINQSFKFSIVLTFNSL